MRPLGVIGVVFLFTILFSASAQAQLTCSFSATGCAGGEVSVFRASALKDAHAELPSESAYTYDVCCSDPSKTLKNTCDGVEGVDYAVVLRLSSATNAHVEENTLSTYTQQVCLGTASQGISAACTYTTGICSDTCVATISATTNAHVADCDGTDDYSIKVCCVLSDDQVAPILTYQTPPTPADFSTAMGDAGDNVNWIFVDFTANEPLSSCWVEVGLSGGVKTNYTATIDPMDNTRCFYNTSSDFPGGLIDGEYEFQAYANDTVKNTGAESQRTVTIAVDFPAVAITQPNDGDLFTLPSWVGSIDGTASDVQDGVTAVDISIDNSLGECWKAGGFWEISGCPTWIATTDTSGGAPAYSTWSYAFPASAPHAKMTVQARATDGSSKQTISQSLTFSLDSEIPLSAIANPLDWGSTGNPTPTISGDASDPLVSGYTSGVEKIEYRLQQGFVCTVGVSCAAWFDIISWTSSGVTYIPAIPPMEELGPVMYDFTLPTLVPSVWYNISVRAIDYAGNVQSLYASDVFQFAEGFPEIEITFPLPTEYKADNWLGDITGTANDDDIVTSVDLQIENEAGLFWDGASFVAAPTWVPAFDTSGPNPAYSMWAYPFTPPADGVFTIYANATDNAALPQITQDQVTFVYDISHPNVTFTLPNWTITNFVNISWDGSDDTSGVKEYSLEYREYFDGLPTIPWTPWFSTPTPFPGGISFGPEVPFTVKNNHTYSFNLTATDFAGNLNSTVANTSIDLFPPICTMEPFNQQYVSYLYDTPLPIRWNITEGESGIIDVGEDQDIYVAFAGSGAGFLLLHPSNPVTWPLFQPCNLVPPDFEGLDCGLSVPVEGVWQVMCSATDGSGQVGPNSTSVTFHQDFTPPLEGSFTEPAGDWVKTPAFQLDWQINDAPSASPAGIASSVVQWSLTGGAPWTNLSFGGVDNLTVTSLANVGAGTYGEPLLAHGDSLFFQMAGIDGAKNHGPYSAVKGVSIDTQPPLANVTAYDQNNMIISTGSLAGVTDLNIASEGEDRDSGIQSHTVVVEFTDEGFLGHQEYSCAAGGESSYCEANITVGNKIEISFWAVVTDLAGNTNVTEATTLATHPLANFVTHDIFLTLGTKTLVDVQVRNLNSSPIDLNLSLSGYSLAGFVDGSGDFASEDLVIYNGGADAGIENFPAGGRGTLKVEIISGDPDGGTQTLNLDAEARPVGEMTIVETDSDSTTISLGFAPSFSGLTDWALALLVLLAVGMYINLGRKKRV